MTDELLLAASHSRPAEADKAAGAKQPVLAPSCAALPAVCSLSAAFTDSAD